MAGVGDRAVLQTADAFNLPMPDASFDCVVSLLCLHNIEGAAARAEACRQIARVLKPGGVALIGDYVRQEGNAAAFRAAGLSVVRHTSCFGTALSLMWLIHAAKPSVPAVGA